MSSWRDGAQQVGMHRLMSTPIDSEVAKTIATEQQAGQQQQQRARHAQAREEQAQRQQSQM